MLTRKQCELLNFIHRNLQETGVSPSFEEMKSALDLRSKSGIHRLIRALEERGFLRRLPHRARALEVLKLPDDATPREARSFKPSVVEGGKQAEYHAPVREESVVIPIMGRIAAGTAIEAIQTRSDEISVPESMLRSGEHFALHVEGDSMVGAGILDGDIAIIHRTDTALNGDIVVALIDAHEATLKRLRRRGDSIALEAANPAHETRIFGPERIQVQGKLAGLFRRY